MLSIVHCKLLYYTLHIFLLCKKLQHLHLFLDLLAWFELLGIQKEGVGGVGYWILKVQFITVYTMNNSDRPPREGALQDFSRKVV